MAVPFVGVVDVCLVGRALTRNSHTFAQPATPSSHTRDMGPTLEIVAIVALFVGVGLTLLLPALAGMKRS